MIHSQKPFNELACNLPAIQLPLHVLCQGLGFSSDCTVVLSLPNIPFAPNNPPENTEHGFRGNDFHWYETSSWARVKEPDLFWALN